MLREQLRDVAIQYNSTLEDLNKDWLSTPETCVINAVFKSKNSEPYDIDPIMISVACDLHCGAGCIDLPDLDNPVSEVIPCEETTFLTMFGGGAVFEWSHVLEKSRVPPLSTCSPGTSDFDWQYNVDIRNPILDKDKVVKLFADRGYEASEVPPDPDTYELQVDPTMTDGIWEIINRRIMKPSECFARANMSRIQSAIDSTIQIVARDTSIPIARVPVSTMKELNVTDCTEGDVIGPPVVFDEGIILSCCLSGGYLKHQWTFLYTISGKLCHDHVFEVVVLNEPSKGKCTNVRLPSGIVVPDINYLLMHQLAGARGRLRMPFKFAQNASRALWLFKAIQRVGSKFPNNGFNMVGYIDSYEVRNDDVALLVAGTPFGFDTKVLAVFREAKYNYDEHSDISPVSKSFEHMYWGYFLTSVYGLNYYDYNDNYPNVSGWWHVVEQSGYCIFNVARTILFGNKCIGIGPFPKLENELKLAATNHSQFVEHIRNTLGHEITMKTRWDVLSDTHTQVKTTNATPPTCLARLVPKHTIARNRVDWKVIEIGDQLAWGPS